MSVREMIAKDNLDRCLRNRRNLSADEKEVVSRLEKAGLSDNISRDDFNALHCAASRFDRKPYKKEPKETLPLGKLPDTKIIQRLKERRRSKAR